MCLAARSQLEHVPSILGVLPHICLALALPRKPQVPLPTSPEPWLSVWILTHPHLTPSASCLALTARKLPGYILHVGPQMFTCSASVVSHGSPTSFMLHPQSGPESNPTPTLSPFICILSSPSSPSLSHQNVTSNHRASDTVVCEGRPQVLNGRFMYGPLDVVTLTGEKVSGVSSPALTAVNL